VAGSLRSIENSSYLIGTRTRDLSACSIVPQPTTLPRAQLALIYIYIYQKINQYEMLSLDTSIYSFQMQEFYSPSTIRLALGFTQPLDHWLLGTLTPRIRQTEYESDPSSPSNGTVKNAYLRSTMHRGSYTFTPKVTARESWEMLRCIRQGVTGRQRPWPNNDPPIGITSPRWGFNLSRST
jgi:hypothetical protein